MIFLRYLGPVHLTIDGSDAPAELLWRKNLALLIYLARSLRGRTREHLTGILWPDKNDTKARHSLNEALRVLRRSLGPDLVTEGETVRIEPGGVSGDVERLDQLATEALGLRFLEGFVVPDAQGFEQWLTSERDTVQSGQLRVLGERSEKALDRGDATEARTAALAALNLDPHHEPTARLAMKAAALEGRRAVALVTFDRLTAMLADIGIVPEAQTRALAERIRTERIRPGVAPAAAEEEPPTALAGKARSQLADIVKVWAAAMRGAAGAVVVVGDPGTGKTRLVEELSGRARLDGAMVARGRAVEGEEARDTWAALLRGGLAVPELGGASPAALASLATLDPDLAVRFRSARDARPLPLGEAWQAAIQAIAETRPVLLVLDDAHRAAAEVVTGLAALLERAGRLPVCLVVAAARGVSSAVDALAERVGRDLPGEVVVTTALTGGEVADLIAATFPAYEEVQRTRLARRVVADTAGNPFLAVEVVRAVQSGLNLADSPPSPWPAAGRTLDATRPGDLPESVAAALRLRFRQLTVPAQQALAAVAVLGDDVRADVLARATELLQPDIDRALDELEWSRWLIGDSRGYAFATRISREVVLGDMVTGGQQRRIRERANPIGG